MKDLPTPALNTFITMSINRRDFLKMSAAAAASAGIASSGQAEANAGGTNLRNHIPSGEPYKLAGHRLVFTNWHFIRSGSFAWYDKHGNNVTVSGSVPRGQAHYRGFDIAKGISIKARQAVRVGPVFKPQEWHESSPGIMLATVLQDGGRYRAWGQNQYYESENGIDWKRPNLGIIDLNGRKDNNRLDINLTGGTVFIDPAAPPPERYKFVGATGISKEGLEEYKKRRPNGWEWRAIREDVHEIFGVGGAYSEDGIKWTRIPEPFSIEHSDTHITGYYDIFTQKYVIYTRNYMISERAPSFPADRFLMWWDAGRRSIGRTESDNFREFPLSEVILVPTPEMLPTDLLYTNCRTTIPGAPDHHLMFPAVWNVADDRTSTWMASSHNGKAWTWIPGSPVFKTAKYGEWDGGCHFALPNLIELSNGDWALPYNGFDVPHKYPRGQWNIAGGYAVWPKGRLVGLDAARKGEFATVAIVPPGRSVYINAETKPGGKILVEAADLSRNPLPGRTFADATALTGDITRAKVTWKDHDNFGGSKDEPVILRFRMENASIYGLEFV